MCGGCGAAPHDPVGGLVSGPLRRSAIARAASAVTPTLVVKPVTGGWTVSTRTGRSSVCRTLGQLVDAMLPTDAHRRAELTRALLDVAENAVIDSGNHIV